MSSHTNNLPPAMILRDAKSNVPKWGVVRSCNANRSYTPPPPLLGVSLMESFLILSTIHACLNLPTIIFPRQFDPGLNQTICHSSLNGFMGFRGHCKAGKNTMRHGWARRLIRDNYIKRGSTIAVNTSVPTLRVVRYFSQKHKSSEQALVLVSLPLTFGDSSKCRECIYAHKRKQACVHVGSPWVTLVVWKCRQGPDQIVRSKVSNTLLQIFMLRRPRMTKYLCCWEGLELQSKTCACTLVIPESH